MNKIAPIAFVLLLSCGAALWFLASDSLNVHIKSQLVTLASTLSQQKVNVENVTMRTYQGNGTITNFTIDNANSSAINKMPLLVIASIDLVINRESLKKEVIVIESLTLSGVAASYSFSESGTNFEQLTSTVQRNIKRLALNDNENNGQPQSRKMPVFKVSKVILEPSVLTQISIESQQLHTKTLPAKEWSNIGGDTGVSGEEIGIQIFEQLLTEFSEQAKNSLNITNIL